MTFPNLPGPRNAQARANLEMASYELGLYLRRVEGCKRISYIAKKHLADRCRWICDKIPNATPETAGELFTEAWHLCREMEKML